MIFWDKCNVEYNIQNYIHIYDKILLIKYYYYKKISESSFPNF